MQKEIKNAVKIIGIFLKFAKQIIIFNQANEHKSTNSRFFLAKYIGLL